MDFSQLDNPAWHALNGRHARLAMGGAKARRYLADVSIMAGIESPAALPQFADLLAEGESAVLWSPDVLEAPADVELMLQFPCLQMTGQDFRAPPAADDAPSNDVLALTAADVPDMLELVGLTQPGPFGARTIEMGDYIGLREHGRLVAMAGERMKPDSFTEVSAICTHPDWQGRGLARRLTTIMCRRAVADGKVPFLNVLPENAGAINLYESLGFRPRRLMQVHVFRKPGGDAATDSYFSALKS
jgi:ribosomal protein S18 acetylase RimI-like enzyme